MVISLDSDLEAALVKAATQRGVAPEAFALSILRARVLGQATPLQPLDEWERGLLAIPHECGVSLSNEALSRESLYD